MKLLRQIVLFAGVGCCATLAHVGLAWSLMGLSLLEPYLANLIGASLAYCVSFLGNACLTFCVRQPLSFYAARYLLVSVVSLVLTTAELAIVTRLGLPSQAYALGALLTVPPATFLVARFWVFAAHPAERQLDRPSHRTDAARLDMRL